MELAKEQGMPWLTYLETDFETWQVLTSPETEDLLVYPGKADGSAEQLRLE